MFVKKVHEFSLSFTEMYRLQKELSKKIVQKKLEKEPRIIAAFDVSYEGNIGLGVLALFDYPEINLLKVYTSTLEVNFPYIPGFLSFRELPVFIKTLEKLDEKDSLTSLYSMGTG
jgi:deoxyribonuclease V